MKKYLFLLMAVLAFTATETNAQVNALIFSGATHDTLTNSNTVYAYPGNATGKIVGRVTDMGFHLRPIKNTGTTIGGYAILQGSNDGTNWFNWFGTSADSQTIANTASLQNLHWNVGAILYQYARLRILGNQTQTVLLDGDMSVRGK